jgi:hypothetical protein
VKSDKEAGKPGGEEGDNNEDDRNDEEKVNRHVILNPAYP